MNFGSERGAWHIIGITIVVLLVVLVWSLNSAHDRVNDLENRVEKLERRLQHVEINARNP